MMFPPALFSMTRPFLCGIRVSNIHVCLGLRELIAITLSLFRYSKSLNFYSFVFLIENMGTIFDYSEVSTL